jgi:hypothetical protein
VLDDYLDNFAAYLRTGNTGGLAAYLEEDANPAFAAVYRNGYLRTCVEALGANFPTVKSIVGDEFFKELALEYVRQYPPTRTTLAGYGIEFPRLLLDRQESHGLAYLADIAALDYAWLECYFDTDHESLTARDIEDHAARGRDITELAAGLSAGVRLVTTRLRVTDIWVQIRDTGKLERVFLATATPENVLVWREDDIISVRSLSGAEFVFLDTLRCGASLGAAAEAALALDGGFDVAASFAELLRHGILNKPKDNP